MRRQNFYVERIMEEQAPGAVAKDRLKRAIQSERMKVSDDVMSMMQDDLRALIERYLGTTIEESDLVFEINKR